MVESGMIDNLVQQTFISREDYAFSQNFNEGNYDWKSFNKRYIILYQLLANFCKVETCFKKEILNHDFLDSVIVVLSFKGIYENEEFLLSLLNLLKMLLPKLVKQQNQLIYQLSNTLFSIMDLTENLEIKTDILECLDSIYKFDEEL